MFQAGYDKGITWGQDGGAAPAPVNITGWDVDDGGDLVDISHTGTKGRQAFIAALGRGGVNITAFFDSGQVPSSIGIKFGTKGTLTVQNGSSNPWSVHVIIEKVHWSSRVNGAVGYNFDVKSDAIDSTGKVVAPADWQYPS